MMLLSRGAADYLIIHELAHLRTPNHSPDFWKTVEEHCPDFKKHKTEIREKSPWLRFPAPSDLRKEPG
jgi:predicted metal-dependent hydrolase